jgi:uncharacterized repeat protein (TIGR04076 family)
MAVGALGKLLPPGMCPFLYYNLTPYIYTISIGGWFDWVIADKDTNFRKSIDKNDFHRKRVNSLYPNEVLVRCPNPHARVVAGVGLWGEEEIKVRILDSTMQCPADYNADDEFIVDKKEFGRKSIDFNMSFPLALYTSVVGQAYRSSRHDCRLGSSMAIDIYKIAFPCRYHKKRRVFRDRFLPGGFCWHVFGAIYPQVLAVMYHAIIDREITVKHPATAGYITLAIDKVRHGRHLFFRKVKVVLRKLSSVGFYPVDLIDYDIEISVLEKGEAECFLKKGKKYMVNMRDKELLCPASVHALYPYMILESRGHRLRWNGRIESNLVPCPDCIGAVYSVGSEQCKAA